MRPRRRWDGRLQCDEFSDEGKKWERAYIIKNIKCSCTTEWLHIPGLPGTFEWDVVVAQSSSREWAELVATPLALSSQMLVRWRTRVDWMGNWICENTGPLDQSYSQRKVDDFECSEMSSISIQMLWEQIYGAQIGLCCFQWATLLVAWIVPCCHQPWHSSGHVFGSLGTGMNGSYSERADPEGKTTSP